MMATLSAAHPEDAPSLVDQPLSRHRRVPGEIVGQRRFEELVERPAFLSGPAPRSSDEPLVEKDCDVVSKIHASRTW
jgi:hypothetical protein